MGVKTVNRNLSLRVFSCWTKLTRISKQLSQICSKNQRKPYLQNSKYDDNDSMNRESQQKEIIKKNQIGILELKSTITAMKSLEGLNSRSELADKRINKSEDRSTNFSILKNIQEKKKNEKKSSLRDL